MWYNTDVVNETETQTKGEAMMTNKESRTLELIKMHLYPQEKKVANSLLTARVFAKRYYKAIPIQDIKNALQEIGLVLLQEDLTEWSGLLCGGVDETIDVVFEIGRLMTKRTLATTGSTFYSWIKNAALHLSYHKMPESGKWEIIGHIV